MSDIYYEPEKFGLATVGEIEWTDKSYSFDLTVVFRDGSGQLFYADDSGCSCPGVMEDFHKVEDLTACTVAELQAHLESRNADNQGSYGGGPRDMQIADLMSRVNG